MRKMRFENSRWYQVNPWAQRAGWCNNYKMDNRTRAVVSEFRFFFNIKK